MEWIAAAFISIGTEAAIISSWTKTDYFDAPLLSVSPNIWSSTWRVRFTSLSLCFTWRELMSCWLETNVVLWVTRRNAFPARVWMQSLERLSHFQRWVVVVILSAAFLVTRLNWAPWWAVEDAVVLIIVPNHARPLIGKQITRRSVKYGGSGRRQTTNPNNYPGGIICCCLFHYILRSGTFAPLHFSSPLIHLSPHHTKQMAGLQLRGSFQIDAQVIQIPMV